METETHHCYGCGGSFAREELQYRPFGKGAYRKNAYYCPVCNEKQKKKKHLRLQSHHSETHYQPDQQTHNYDLHYGISEINFS